MTDHAITHATFSLERTYPVPPKRTFRAWADRKSRSAGSPEIPKITNCTSVPEVSNATGAPTRANG